MWDDAVLIGLGRRGHAGRARRVQAVIAAFLARFTKAELDEEALRRRFMLALLSEPRDLLDNVQLGARRFFAELDQPGPGRLAAPGPFARFSATPLTVGPAPAPGAHTAEVVVEAATRRPRRPVPEPSPPAAPFAGLRVLDFAWAAAGPLVTRLLAAFGADVVRVESARHPDPLRILSPWKDGTPGVDRSYLWANYNAGKRGITLNLDTAEGRALARRLARRADVVAEAFTPGVMARRGLDYACLAAENPGW